MEKIYKNLSRLAAKYTVGILARMHALNSAEESTKKGTVPLFKDPGLGELNLVPRDALQLVASKSTLLTISFMRTN